MVNKTEVKERAKAFKAETVPQFLKKGSPVGVPGETKGIARTNERDPYKNRGTGKPSRLLVNTLVLSCSRIPKRSTESVPT